MRRGGRRVRRGVDRLTLAAGLAFVLAGVAFLLDALGVWHLESDYLLPLGLILAGLVVLATAAPSR